MDPITISVSAVAGSGSARIRPDAIDLPPTVPISITTWVPDRFAD